MHAQWKNFVIVAGTLVVLCLLNGCGGEKTYEPSQPSQPIRVERLDPAFTARGRVFNVQPKGEAAVAVTATGLPSEGAVVLWNGTPLKTGSAGSRGWVGAEVPESLYSVAGQYPIAIRDEDGRVSNSIPFTVYPDTGPAPAIKELYPVSAIASVPFNIQPGGDSAIAVNGSGFLPEARIVFDGKELKTGFSSPTALTALVPKELVASPRDVPVWVVNLDKKKSNQLVLRIARKN